MSDESAWLPEIMSDESPRSAATALARQNHVGKEPRCSPLGSVALALPLVRPPFLHPFAFSLVSIVRCLIALASRVRRQGAVVDFKVVVFVNGNVVACVFRTDFQQQCDRMNTYSVRSPVV
jgi:hypothetical protein